MMIIKQGGYRLCIRRNRGIKGITELAATYVSISVRESIIGDELLSFLVRNGTGRFQLSIATRIVN